MTASAARPATLARCLLGAALVVTVPVLAACGDGSAQRLGAAPGSTVPSSAPSGPASATTSPGSAAGSAPAGGISGRSITVTGTVIRGAEPSCLILRTPTAAYELQGRLTPQVREGAQVRVTGHVVHGVLSHCMQGQPFAVTSVGQP